MADLTQTPANVKLQANAGQQKRVAVGEAVTQGQPARYDSATQTHFQAQADSADNAAVVGIFLTPAPSGGFAMLALPGSEVDLGATLVVGETYVVSATKGAIAPIGDLTTGDFSTILGTATAVDKLPLSITASSTAKA